jgi:hypothetical protein
MAPYEERKKMEKSHVSKRQMISSNGWRFLLELRSPAQHFLEKKK